MTIAEKLQTIAENEPKVYEAGREKGYREGYTDATSGTAFETDDSTAYLKIVPSASEKLAQVLKLGGMSYKSKNLLPFPYSVIGDVGASKVNMGITCNVEEDRAVMFNGTCTSTAIHFDIAKITLKSGTYNLSIGDYKGSSSTIQFALYNTANSQALASDVYFGNATNRTFTVVNEGEILIRAHIYKVTLNNVRFYLMLNEGSTALPYEPFFEGIRSAKVTELVSEGVNLFDISKALNDVLVDNGDGTYTITNKGNVNGTDSRFSKKVPLFIPANTSFTSKGVPISGTKASFTIGFADTSLNRSIAIDGYARTHKYANDVTYIQIYYPFQYGEGSETFADFQIEYGTKATEYKPYVGTLATKPIPEALRNFLEQYGYGLGINETYYNYIDYVRKVFAPNVKAVDLGSLVWQSVGGRFRTATPISNIKYISNTQSICLSDIYENYAYNELYSGLNTDGFKGISVDGSGYIQVVDKSYSTVSDFSSAMQGKKLIYAVAEPIEIDISAYLTGDNLIEVQGGGTITAVNEYELAAPTTIQFIKKVGA